MLDRKNTDVESDFEACRARELSLSLQNRRLKGLIKQNSFSPPTSPGRVESDRGHEKVRSPSLNGTSGLSCDAEIIAEGVHYPQGKIVFGISLLTILPIQTSFSVAEYVGYRIVASIEQPSEETIWEKGGSFLKYVFTSLKSSANEKNKHFQESEEHVVWELLWKKSVGHGQLCRLKLKCSKDSFEDFEILIQEWATSPLEATIAQDNALAAEDHENELAANNNSTPDSVPENGVNHALDNRAENKIDSRHRNTFQKNKEITIGEQSCMLLPEHVEALTKAIPDRFRHQKWSLAYSTNRDGISLQTLYRRIDNKSPTVICVKDFQDYVFGIFASDPWQVHHKFYGTGETFVFQLQPNVQMHHWNQSAHSDAQRNNFFMFSTANCIAVGGGGHFAIWLDEDLMYGNSSACKTFDNECLSGSENFEVLSIEVWHIN